MHFGSTLKLLRAEAGLSLRELAARVGVSSAYLSRIETGRDASPTPDRLASIADALGLPRRIIIELARQTGPAVTGYVERVPAAGALFLDIARRDLNAVQIARIKAFIDAELPAPDDTARPRGRRLLELLPPAHMVLGARCRDMDELIHLAAERWPDGTGVDRDALVRQLQAREREATTFVGSGFVVPHATQPGVTDAAVLVTLAEPLPLVTPDDRPVRVAVVLVDAEAGPDHLEALARIARLATHDLAPELCAAKTPEQVQALLWRVEHLW